VILAIAGRELRSLFLSPLAWSLLAVMQLILGWLFLVQLEEFLQIQPRLAALEGAPGVTRLVLIPLFDSAAIILMLLVPLLGMGLFSREYALGTFSLLLSSPVSMTRIVIGKYLALLGVLILMLILMALMSLSLLLGTSLDLGTLAAGLLGLGLVVSSYAAVSLFLSSLTRHPAIAAVSSYGILLLLWTFNLTTGPGEGGLREQLALSGHFQRLLNGLVVSSDVAYFLLLILASLILAIRRLDTLRRQG